MLSMSENQLALIGSRERSRHGRFSYRKALLLTSSTITADLGCRGSLAWFGRQTHNLECVKKGATPRSREFESRPRHHKLKLRRCAIRSSFLKISVIYRVFGNWLLAKTAALESTTYEGVHGNEREFRPVDIEMAIFAYKTQCK